MTMYDFTRLMVHLECDYVTYNFVNSLGNTADISHLVQRLHRDGKEGSHCSTGHSKGTKSMETTPIVFIPSIKKENTNKVKNYSSGRNLWRSYR